MYTVNNIDIYNHNKNNEKKNEKNNEKNITLNQLYEYKLYSGFKIQYVQLDQDKDDDINTVILKYKTNTMTNKYLEKFYDINNKEYVHC